MNWVDLKSNVTYTLAQLDKRYKAAIRSKYSMEEEMELRLGSSGIIALEKINLYKEQVLNQYYEAISANDKLKNVIHYEEAQERLNRYILSEGREEVSEETDPETGEITQEHIPGIAPLPTTVEHTYWNEETEQQVTENIPNPLVVQDESERAIAQNIIDSATQTTLNLYAKRNPND